MLLDQLEVVPGDLVVVVLQLSKGLFVVLHELVDMQVLALLQLVNFHPLLELQFFLHPCQLSLVVLLDLEELIIVSLHHESLLPFVILFGDFSLLDVLLLIVNEILLEVLFFLLHVLHAVLVVAVLFDLGVLSVLFDVHVGLFLFVLQQF